MKAPVCDCKLPARSSMIKNEDGSKTAIWKCPEYVCDYLEEQDIKQDTATQTIDTKQPKPVAFSVFSSNQIAISIVDGSSGNGAATEKILSQMDELVRHPERDLWMLEATATAYASAVKNLKASSCPMTPSPDTVIQILQEDEDYNNRKSTNIDADTESRIREIMGASVWTSLRAHQREGVRQAVERYNGRLLIADDMGLAKTFQALAICMAYRDHWPALVICPASVRVNWAEEAKKWLTLKDSDLQVSFRSQDFQPDDQRVKFFIVSYDLVIRHIEKFLKRKFDFIICDASHYLKNTTAKRTQHIIPMLQETKHVVLLSGTPILAKPGELYTQISALRPGLFPSRKDYGMRYCAAKQTRSGWAFDGACNLEELHLVLERAVMLRRLKADLSELQLPTKHRKIVLIELSSNDRKHFEKGSRGGMFKMFSDFEKAKVTPVLKYLAHLFENASKKPKIIFFAYHMEMLNAVENDLIKRKIGYIRIDGKTSKSFVRTCARNSKKKTKFKSPSSVSPSVLA